MSTSASSSERTAEGSGDGGPNRVTKLAFEHVINPVMRTLLRSPLHGLVSDHLLLLTFTGRKSGETYTTPVGYHREGETVVVSTESPWWRNLKGGAPVTVGLRGERRQGVATPHPEPERAAEHVRRFVEERGADAARRRFRIDVGDDPDPEELREAVEGLVVIEIELDGEVEA